MKPVDQVRLRISDEPTACCFRPSSSDYHTLLIGTRNGYVRAFSVGEDDQIFMYDRKQGDFCSIKEEWENLDCINSGLCRALCVMPDADSYIAASAAGTIGHLNRSGRSLNTIESNADDEDAGEDEEDAIFCLEVIDNNTFASGHADGSVKLWDLREASTKDDASSTFDEQSDHITSLYYHEAKRSLFATSGDGTLAVYDSRKGGQLKHVSDPDDDELLCVTVVKGGKKVVTGSEAGVMGLWSWGHFEDCSDRFPGHPQSIDCMLRFDDDTVLTGSADGALRVVNILPNKLLGVLGDQTPEKNRPPWEESDSLSRMAMSGDRRFLASLSLDAMSLHPAVTLWDLSVLHDDSDEEEAEDKDDDDDDGDAGDNDDEDADAEEDKRPAKKQRKDAGASRKTSMKKASGKAQGGSNFFKGLL